MPATNYVKYTLMSIVCLNILPVFTVDAAVSLDRTRAIFDGSSTSMVLNISNDNKQLPYLAQAWLENDKNEKITSGPLVITPPIQRMEPGSKSMVRVSSTPEISKLPQDRESLFYFNLREIPPRSEKANVLQIALQTKIKLFYRPESIKTAPNEVWQDKLILRKVGNGYDIENPTPYFITIIGLGDTENKAKEGEFETVMISPKSHERISQASYSNTLYLSYINDYGGRPVLTFKCKDSVCTVSRGSTISEK